MAEQIEILRIEVDQESAQKALVAYEQRLVKLKEEQAKFRKELRESNGQNKEAAQGLVNVSQKIDQNTQKRKELTKTIKTESGSLQALRNQLAKTVQLRNQVNTSTDIGKKRFNDLTKSIKLQTESIKKAEQAGGDFRRNVGNYSSALEGASPIMGGFTSRIVMMGNALKAMLLTPIGLVIGAIGAFVGIMARAVKGAKSFQSANAELASVLGKTREEIGLLREDAIRLGSTTAFTAEQVTRLQISLAKLGFAENQILDMSKAIIDLSTATKQSADDVATFTGATLKQYGLLSSESGRIADVSARAFSSSALDFEKLSTMMSIVGTTASIAGESFESTTAKLGILADRGIDASTAATGLRNIYLELANKGLTWNEAMTQINESTDKLNKANELFGKRGATISLILAGNAEGIGELQSKLEDVSWGVQKMVDEQLNTLEGSLTLLKSAWDGLFLSIEDGEGALTNISKAFVDMGTSVLTALTGLNNVLGDENKGFLSKLKTLIGLGMGSADAIAEVTLAATQSTIKAQETAEAEEQVTQAIENQNEANREKARLASEEKKRQAESLRRYNEMIDQKWEERNKEIDAQLEAEEQQKKADAERFASHQKEIDLQKRVSENRAENAQKAIEIERLKNEAILMSSAAAIGALGGLFKKQSNAFKVAQIAEATISAYGAINKTLNDITIPSTIARILMSIAIGARALGNVKKIAGINFTEGGRIGNRGVKVKPDSRGDNRLILAKDTETILNRPQIERIGASTLKRAGVPGYAEGGAVDFSSAITSEVMQADMIMEGIRNLPSPIVGVREITDVTGRVKVKESIAKM